MKKAIYRFFLIILIIGGINTGLYNLFDINLFAQLKGVMIGNVAITKIIYGLIGISAIVVLISNFSFKLHVQAKEQA